MALVDLSDGSLRTMAEPAALELAPDADEAALVEAAKTNGPIAIRFPNFGDGRGMSLAHILRKRHGVSVEIRAVGYLIPDLALFLYRSGFETAEIEDPDNHGSWKDSIGKIRHAYQPGAGNSLALRRNADRGRESGKASGKAMAEALAAELADIADLSERLRTARRAIAGRIAFSTSLGMEDQAILNAIGEARDEIAEKGAIDIFTLDTGRLFPEVLETLELSEIRYRLRIRTISPDAKEVEELVGRDGVLGFRQSVENRKSCCEIRKVRPLNKALSGADGWITGIRREHSDHRAAMPLAEWDETHSLIKVNPLADWTAEELEAYLAEDNVPVNPLHARGFVSIGCQPCTRAVQPDEDPRAGRWWWENEEKKECGLHLNPAREGQAA